jgi:multicomponent Na+:H+ antiporter subunit D
MNIVYLLAPAVRAFMDPPPGGGAHPARTKVQEAPILCVLPAWATAIGTVALFFFMDDLVRYLEPLAS